VILAAVGVAATGLATAPAVAGLAHNPSFSHELRVRVPSDAQTVERGDDQGLTVRPKPSATPSVTPSCSQHPEPGDDRSGSSPEPVDDKGGKIPGSGNNGTHGRGNGNSGSGNSGSGNSGSGHG
jgi:hypothetical protein